MTQTVSVNEAQNKLPDLLADALAGNEVLNVQADENGSIVFLAAFFVKARLNRALHYGRLAACHRFVSFHIC